MVMIVELDDTVRVNEKEDISKTICKRVVIFCVYAVLLLGFRAPKDKQRIVYYSMSSLFSLNVRNFPVWLQTVV